MTDAPDWTILLVGGASAAGKTTLAETLAARFDARYIDLDLFWIVLHGSISAEKAPDLHLLDPHLMGGVTNWDGAPQELVERYLRVSAYVCEACEPLLAHHHIIGRRVVLEGCWVLPAFATQNTYAGRDVGDSVRSLFLHESDSAAVEARIRARPHRWLETLTVSAQRNHLEMQSLYGETIAAQARALGLPVLESMPFDTLEARAIAAFT
jgi:2-phosphoglycerate kinase